MKNRWALHFADAIAAPRIGKDEREQRSSMTATLSLVLKIVSMAAVIRPTNCSPESAASGSFKL